MGKRVSGNDPFSAGEPELPWNGLAIDEEAENATTATGSTTSGVPAHRAHQASAAEADEQPAGRTAPANTAVAHVQHEDVAPHHTSDHGAHYAQATSPDSKGPSPSEGHPADGAPSNTKVAARTRAAATPATGPRRGRRGCLAAAGIVIALNLVLPLTVLLPQCSTLALDNGGRIVVSDTATENTDGTDAAAMAVDPATLDEERQQILAAATATLDGIPAPDGTARIAIANGFAQSVIQNLGYTVDDLGIDAFAYADFALTDFTYTVVDVTAADSPDRPGERDGAVRLDATTPDAGACLSDFFQQARDYLEQQGIAVGTGAVLADQQRLDLQSLFTQTLDAYRTSRLTTASVSLSLIPVDGAWTVTDQSFTACLQQLFRVG